MHCRTRHSAPEPSYIFRVWFKDACASLRSQATNVVTKTCAPLLRKFAPGRARTAEANQIRCEFVHLFLPFGIEFRVSKCTMPWALHKRTVDWRRGFSSPASCFLSYCRFKLSFGKFGVDIVAVQLFVNESGRPMHGVDEYTVWEFLRGRRGF